MENEEIWVPSEGLRRRELLIAGAAAGLTLALPLNHAAMARGRRVPFAGEAKFSSGVSSGFPSPRAITLWTRVFGIDRTCRLTLEVAKDRQFRKVVERREVIADARRDFTVHTRVDRLQPARQYFYRFETKRSQSRVGRFRTLPPADSKQPVRIGFYSCQSYESGYFTPHAALAGEKDLDLVLCLGDYVYEHHFYDGPVERADRTGTNKDGDVQSLAEYRQKYRFYQSDKDLQDMHANHPFVAIWDDHELEDNYNSDGNSPNQPDPNFDNTMTPRRTPFTKRRVNGYRAFFESMPRLQNKKNRNSIYGSLKFGGTAELFLTDQRQYRDPQPCGDKLLSPCPEEDEPGRTMLGAAQKRWLKRAVPASKAKWKLWGSQVMMMALDLPVGKPVNPDQWDGYAAERREILEHFHGAGVKNLAVLSGDIHTFFAGELTTNGDVTGTPLGVEFGGGSVTSLGIPESVNVSSPTLLALMPDNDPHIKFADFDHRGYGVVTASRNKLVGELKGVETTTAATSPISTLARFEVAAGRPELIRI
ncbi:MAG TPA: alkaline phosphatase D family protein [Solirubrobacterales bacterium]|nr:alkaline phosphatase D family protein [Solirubrobacterales bacterium]